MLNHTVLIGRLTKDPEIRRSASGVAVASFTLAVDRDFPNKETGQRETDFIDIVAWRNTAEFVERNLSKGRLACVSGRLQIRTYQDKNDNRRYVPEVMADNVYPIGPRGEKGDTAEPERRKPASGGRQVDEGYDADYPF